MPKRLFDHAVNVRFTADVRLKGECLMPGASEFSNGCFRFGLRGVVVNHEFAAPFGKRKDDGFPYTLCAAGDEGDFAAEVHRRLGKRLKLWLKNHFSRTCAR